MSSNTGTERVPSNRLNDATSRVRSTCSCMGGAALVEGFVDVGVSALEDVEDLRGEDEGRARLEERQEFLQERNQLLVGSVAAQVHVAFAWSRKIFS